MKPSGIEWIGDVPEEWQLMKLKFTAKMMRGKFSHRPRNDARLYGGEYPFIQTGDVTKTEKYISTYSQTLNEWGYSVSKEFPCGTVVITISANIGDIAILNFNGCFPDSVVGFFSNSNINEYLFYLLKSMKNVFISESIEGTQLNLNVERLSSIKVALPEPMEQLAILDFIKTETATIDTLITKYQKQIELMQEYRTALISQAVTGKIDVRGWQPKTKEVVK
ncbi:restriction endonuclease subunit S [Methylovulum psychrotolerans]|uniref:Restriction endonuclease subunit S n=1 Tax=Methylovulum psychrotolerans TaxID=1704499 RepID=A0A1Z4C489_9GAMM|nr:restriction endonuclease subunit S [Methylovulum psychrotolerans]ASF48318.1 restriction endonuclease subunit S [Methylovulum psychrotolerans]